MTKKRQQNEKFKKYQKINVCITFNVFFKCKKVRQHKSAKHHTCITFLIPKECAVSKYKQWKHGYYKLSHNYGPFCQLMKKNQCKNVLIRNSTVTGENMYLHTFIFWEQKYHNSTDYFQQI